MSETPLHIWQEGIRPPEVDAQETRLDVRPFPYRAASLFELLPDWALFTPAIPYLCGHLEDQPLVDFALSRSSGFHLYHRWFPDPLFEGLTAPNGDKDWNHVLWFCPRHHWSDLVDWMGSLVLVNLAKEETIHCPRQLVKVPDVLNKRLTGPAPESVLVSVFTAGMAKVHWAMRPPRPPATLYALHKYEGDELMQAFRTALFSGRNPADQRHDRPRRLKP